ncbi:thioredoxin domain-containing protein [Baekduia soli]|uniref:hypothetical protein n=1 Tax=Baekduia soli TaxID=496014 RepID=UPI001651CEC7|nr:hypothetical protein [Baekduia soli]
MLDRVRVRAPELEGAGGWIGSDGLTLAGLRGRIVLLDFWTLACVNCQRVVEELRGLERRFADVLVVVGVHWPKFPTSTTTPPSAPQSPATASAIPCSTIRAW